MRLNTVKKDYTIRPVKLANVLQDVMLDNGILLEEAGFKVHIECDGEEVCTDERSLLFVISQIISNAVKYAGKDPHLSLIVKEDTTHVILAITDNGQGISQADLPFVFEQGFTGEKGSYMTRSTGMGLYLVKGICDALHITIAITSVLHEKTTVTLSFPK